MSDSVTMLDSSSNEYYIRPGKDNKKTQFCDITQGYFQNLQTLDLEGYF